MDMFKDRECTEPAKCPLSHANPLLDQYGAYTCDTNCAWSVYVEEDDAYMCGVPLLRQLMYAEAVE